MSSDVRAQNSDARATVEYSEGGDCVALSVCPALTTYTYDLVFGERAGQRSEYICAGVTTLYEIYSM